MSHSNPRFGGYSIRENGLWLSDVTTADASTAKHGLLPKLPNDSTKYLNGQGNYVALTGSGAPIPDWITGHPDTPPASANAEDDEFESTSLDAKWSESLSGTPTRDIHTSQLSHYWLYLGSSEQSVINQTAPTGTGTFSLTAKVFFGGSLSGSNVAIYLYAEDIGGTNAIYTKLYISGTSWSNSLLKQESGGFGDNGVTIIGGGMTHQYLHLQRKASNVWESWASIDGRSFYRITTVTFSFTVARIGLILSNGSSSILGQFGVDWFRRDWLTL